MNRTDRLYALVEELRASAPRARSAQRLAERFEVGVRTIQRDLLALQEAGVPIWATPGPGGGYSIDPGHTLPPLNFTPTEAAAIALAMARSGPMPFGGAARTALHKWSPRCRRPGAAAPLTCWPASTCCPPGRDRRPTTGFVWGSMRETELSCQLPTPARSPVPTPDPTE
jgi:hypothetical protein